MAKQRENSRPLESDSLVYNDVLTLHTRLLDRLRKAFDPEQGCWTGRLSNSALATAVAVTALTRVNREQHARVIRRGLDYILSDSNPDGGWGDSPESPSNLTATLLCWAALSAHTADKPACAAGADRAAQWIDRALGSHTPATVTAGIAARYGGDRTFAAPILTLCAISGAWGNDPAIWEQVPQLPFELALLPHRLFKWLRLTVVSYALPALIAVGIARHRRQPINCPLKRRIRDRAIPGLLDKVRHMQPTNGGFEEATPLTAFVTLSLADAGFGTHPVVQSGVDFLLHSMREEGSWPIDTNLATWVTTLAVNAGIPEPDSPTGPTTAVLLDAPQRSRVRDWLLAQQYDHRHPLSFGAPGGWAWSNLPGAMPDADDTAGVLVALRRLAEPDTRTRHAAEQGIAWLLDLQNSDGGIPTFSRGWGRLPFDRSCPDISAHALHAFSEWFADMPPTLQRRMRKGISRIAQYLATAQQPNGAWLPLWFGCQTAPDQQNPTHGTARAVISLREALRRNLLPPELATLAERGIQQLVSSANADGGWGAAPGLCSSLEDTALAAAALAGTAHQPLALRGLLRLVRCTVYAENMPATPMGLYFDKLWYSEQMYPLVFALLATRRVLAAKPAE